MEGGNQRPVGVRRVVLSVKGLLKFHRNIWPFCTVLFSWSLKVHSFSYVFKRWERNQGLRRIPEPGKSYVRAVVFEGKNNRVVRSYKSTVANSVNGILSAKERELLLSHL